MTQHTKALPILFFDCESIALPHVEQFLPEPRVDKRLKDQEQAKADKIQEMIERAPLDSDLASVKLISMQIGVEGLPMICLVPAKKMSKAKAADLALLVPEGRLIVGDETAVINKFWNGLNLCNGKCCGYNIMGFDLPFLLKRSMDLGIRPGIQPSLAKYRTAPVTDLMGILSNWSWGDNVKKLKWLAKRYDLEVLAPEQDGSMVADMTDAELITYGLSDLFVTVQLYEKMNGVYFNDL